MKTQVYLDENGRTTFNHHSENRITFDKNVFILSVITISVIILLFTMFGVRGQSVTTKQSVTTQKKATANKTTNKNKTTKLITPVAAKDSINDKQKTNNDGISEEKEESPYRVVDVMPEFPGGQDSLIAFIRNEIKYPSFLREDDVYGVVYVTFVVSKTGAIKDVKVLRGIGGGCDEEAVRVIKKMPRWKPGKINGRVVDVQFNLPIKFSIQ